MRVLVHVTAALALSVGASQAATWLDLDALSASSGVGIEVDTDTLRQAGNRREIGVRVTYPQPRIHRWGASFRSVTATVEFECAGRLGGYRDAVYFSEARGHGIVMVREQGPLGAIPASTLDLLPAKNIEMLARAACSRPTAAVP